MALTPDEQKLADAANAALPPWFRGDGRVQEEVGMMAKQVGAAYAHVKHRFEQTYITKAVAATADEPDWLDLLAKDRGTSRQNGETDAQLRLRLQKIPVAVVRSELLTAVQALVTGAGVAGTAVMVELARDAAYLGSFTADTGTGGTFAKDGDLMAFAPTVPFAWPPYVANLPGLVKSTKIVFSGCSAAGNDGTFTITGLVAQNDGDGNPTLTAIYYTNASGAAGTDAGCTWTTQRLDHKDVVLDGWGKSYVNRGYRVWRGQSATGGKLAMGGIVVILPYGSTEALRLSVEELLRQKKAAGIKAIVEARATP